MICLASSLVSNNFVEEDWPFNGCSTYGEKTPNVVNSGFSLRKVPHLLQMLHAQPFDELVAERDPETEDYCFSTSMWKLTRTKMSIGTEAISLGVAVQYSPNNNELLLGFHTFRSDGLFREVEGQANKDEAYKYCLELGIISLGR